jgi:hypothetical protein
LEQEVGGHKEQEPQLIRREARATGPVHGHADLRLFAFLTSLSCFFSMR